MAVLVGTYFERQPRVAIRVGKTIRGYTGGGNRGAMFNHQENGNWLYANVGRSPLVELWGIRNSTPTHRDETAGTTIETTSTALVEVYNVMVNIRSDWVDWDIDARLENAELRVQIYETIARSTTLADQTLSATTVSDETATVTFTPTDYVLVVVKLKRNVGTPGVLHWLRIQPAIMAAADLP